MPKIKSYFKPPFFFLAILFSALCLYAYFYIFYSGKNNSSTDFSYTDIDCENILLDIEMETRNSKDCKKDEDCILIGNSGCPGEFCTNEFAVNINREKESKTQTKMDYYTDKCTEAFEGHCWGCEYFEKAVCDNSECKPAHMD